MPDREVFERKDEIDPLSRFREKFFLRSGLTYLDGNSLGPPPKAVLNRISKVLETEWGANLISSWVDNDWINLPTIVGDKIGQLIGAESGEVAVCDSTSINLFKVLSAALSNVTLDRRVFLSDKSNFPTDLYIARGLISSQNDSLEMKLVNSEEIENGIGTDVAVVLLTHVNYRSGACYDIKRITKLAHDVGAVVVWDLSHSAGVIPLNLSAWEVDYAVGCGYKYLNGGPGAPGYVYVKTALHEGIKNPLMGWMGHAAPFEFSTQYTPGVGIKRMLCGTPNILSMVALEVGVDLLLEADLLEIRNKSTELTNLFIQQIHERCTVHNFSILTPRESDYRGSHVSLAHPCGREISKTLSRHSVICDFRPPDVLRFGFAPLFTRFTDIWDAVETLNVVMEEGGFDKARA